MTLPRPTTVSLILLWVLGCLPAAWLLAGHEADSPYIGTEVFQQVYLTDEGMYTKGALWFSRHGQLCPPYDFCSQTTYPLYTVGVGTAMRLFGNAETADHWRVARAYSIYLSLLALAAFWSLCRVTLPPLSCWLATVSVAFAFQYVHMARLATTDPAGIAFSILSAAVWVRWRSSPAGTAAALLLSLCAFFSKSGYAAYVAALGLCIVWEVLTHWRADRRRQAAWHGFLLIAAAAGGLAIRQLLAAADPVLTRYEQQLYITNTWGFGISIGTGIRYQLLSLFRSALWLPGVPVLLATALFCFWPAGPFRQNMSEKLRQAATDPALRLFTLWAAAGIALYGLTYLQGGRYYLYLVYVLAYAAFWSLSRLAPPALRATPVAVLVVALHLASQGTFYLHWIQQSASPTYLAVCRDVAARITANGADGADARLFGHGLSEWISLFSPRITSIGYGYASYSRVISRAERFRYWRPGYVLINEDDVWLNSKTWEEFLRENSDLIARTEPMAEYRMLFRHVFPNSPVNRAPNLKLLRIHYKDRP